MKPGWKSAALCAGAFLLTLGFAVMQRLTGPTHPLRGEAVVAGIRVGYYLPRSEDSGREAVIRLRDADGKANATLVYRRFPTADPLQAVPFVRDGDMLTAALPSAPPAGKLEYQVRLLGGGESRLIPERAAIIRYKGAVPAVALVPHILCIFLGLFFVNRCALGALARTPSGRDAALGLMGLFLGGLVLGPVVQKYAFGAYWTGFPLGSDLTDTKTLVAVLAWAVAVGLARWKQPFARWAALAGWVVVLAAFAIPHSLYGSQLDWSTVP
ncbi:MAG: hypothetical protein GYA21_18675 [Myxococcales bacterium]|nr:hypothetical protein [Myxococcales bacterium]